MQPINIQIPPASVVDSGMVRVGAGLKLSPSMSPASVVDLSKVRVGAGLKRR